MGEGYHSCRQGIHSFRTGVELVVTLAIRNLFVSRLDIADGGSPVGKQVWYRKKGDRRAPECRGVASLTPAFDGHHGTCS